jgi:hypothetical protein
VNAVSSGVFAAKCFALSLFIVDLHSCVALGGGSKLLATLAADADNGLVLLHGGNLAQER